MENKACILITGASSGMGREMAVRFSAVYRVILNGRDTKRLEETRQLCTNPAEQLIWQYDLTKVEELESSFAAFMSVHQIRISYFVHCAGFMKTYPLKMVTAKLFQDTFNVNVISGALLIKSLMNRKMNDTALKSVVLISSNISNFGAKAFSVYGASKGAVDALMRSFAVELAPRVRVNSVLPGGVRTAMTEHMYQDQELIDRMAIAYPLGLGKVGDIYEAVNFLLSDKAGWVTGQQFTSNCFLLYDREVNNDCLVVDPGSEYPDELEQLLKDLNLYPKYILLTHEHFDHIWGCNYLVEKYHSKIICSVLCSEAIQDAKRNHSLFYNQKAFQVPAADICIEDIGFNWNWNGWGITFFVAEGHTNAGICFEIGNSLFTGDTLLKDLRTVTKLFCGSKEKLVVTINRIKRLQGKGFYVYPGHGDGFDLDNYDLNKAL